MWRLERMFIKFEVVQGCKYNVTFGFVIEHIEGLWKKYNESVYNVLDEILMTIFLNVLKNITIYRRQQIL